MSFFNILERKLLPPVPHKLPDPKFDDEIYRQFNRLRVRSPKMDEDDNLPGDTVRRSFRGDHEMSKPREGLVKVAAEIFRYRFLSCFEQLTENDSGSLQGRIIITDPSSWSMVDRALDWLTLKRAGVSCVFTLNDKVSNELTRSLQIIYLINIGHLNGREFDSFLLNLADRECRSCCIFLAYPIDPFSAKGSLRLKILHELISKKSIPSPWIVGAFHAPSPWLALIDHQVNLNYLRQLVNSPRSSQFSKANRIVCCRLAFRLVNLFEQMNQYPIVRFLKTWHSHNQLIGHFFVKGMAGLREKRRSSPKGRGSDSQTIKYESDYLLVIIDRSVDLLTPILHADHYEAFVEQELETRFPRSTDKLDSEIRNVHINEVTSKLKSLSESFKSMYGQMSVKDQEVTMNYVRSHLAMVTRLTAKINNGYGILLKMERKVLKQLNKNNPQLRKVRSAETDTDKSIVDPPFGKNAFNPELSPLDLHRLVITRSLVSQKLLGSRYLRAFLGKDHFHAKDTITVSKYANLIKTCYDKSGCGQFGFPVIANLIEAIYSGSLREDQFPFAEAWMRNSSPRKKLCIFVLGGISYNEVQLSGVYTSPNQEVTLISDNLLTASSILSKLFS
ncbi:uncharacterized protein LOC128392046 [Panonychus citri]|uniref:uncharacterized protein LOC128392046 n=1 Tax=Panonychus citri TaxID=50023 RepID=UPI0023071390|nr:uncharacterized protein LOC128392046 [Panonychus citri]